MHSSWKPAILVAFAFVWEWLSKPRIGIFSSSSLDIFNFKSCNNPHFCRFFSNCPLSPKTRYNYYAANIAFQIAPQLLLPLGLLRYSLSECMHLGRLWYSLGRSSARLQNPFSRCFINLQTAREASLHLKAAPISEKGVNFTVESGECSS